MKTLLQVRIESSAFEPGAVQIAELKGRETISRLFEFELRLQTLDGPLDEDKLLTSAVTIVFEEKSMDSDEVKELRRITGIVRSILDRAHTESRHFEYLATFVPRAWQSTLSSTSDVCMDVSVPDILKKKLEEGAGIKSGKDVEERLMGSYSAREFVVQYKESNFDFVNRLAEDLGVFYFFEEKDGVDLMVFGDDNTAFKPSFPKSAPYTPRGEKRDVFELESRRQLVSKNFVARDYNYRNPGMDVLGEAESPALGGGKVDEYGPHAKTPAEATQYAKVRAQEATVRSFCFEGKSTLPGVRAGSLLTVEDHPRGKLDLLVTEVEHHIAQSVFGAAATDKTYTNTFRAIPKTTTYRPPRVTPKPVVHGMVTGLVETGSATQVGAIDDQGRYRVSFMYDSVSGRGDGKASRPLRMAQPSAGNDRGFHIPLKAGTEVLITCVNGDPDRPIIAGAVPNPQTPSPVNSSNAEKTILKTNVNQLAIDDTKPRAKFSVNGEDHIFQIGEPNGPEFGVLTASIGNVSSMAAGASTSVSSTLGAYQDYKTAVSAKDIVNMAGIPTPWTLWQKIDAVVTGAIGFAKGMSQAMGAPQQIAIEHATDKKKDADDALAAAKKKAAEDMKLDATPKQKTNPDGTTRMETADEAQDRAMAEAAKNPANQKAMAPVQAAQDASAAAAADLKGLQDWWNESPLNVTTGKEAEAIKDIEAVQSAIKAAGKLYSTIHKLVEKASQNTTLVAMKAAQVVAAKDTLASGQRHIAKVGHFATHFNVQGATNSVGLTAKNALVYGADNANVASTRQVTVVGSKAVNIKSPDLVEVSAEKVVLTSKKQVDVHSSDTMKLVAHTGDKTIQMPASTTLYLHTKQRMLLDSTDTDIDLKAKEYIRLEASTMKIEMKAKKAFTLEVEENDIEMKTKTNDIKFEAKKNAKLLADDHIMIIARNKDFELSAPSGKGTIKASSDLKLECADGTWKNSGDLNVKASNIKLNGSKIELG